MSTDVSFTVADRDGIGPEIMAASLLVVQKAGARVDPGVIEIGVQICLRENSSGIEPTFWESLRRTKVFDKVPITTTLRGGYMSLNGAAGYSLSQRH